GGNSERQPDDKRPNVNVAACANSPHESIERRQVVEQPTGADSCRAFCELVNSFRDHDDEKAKPCVAQLSALLKPESQCRPPGGLDDGIEHMLPFATLGG